MKRHFTIMKALLRKIIGFLVFILFIPMVVAQIYYLAFEKYEINLKGQSRAIINATYSAITSVLSTTVATIKGYDESIFSTINFLRAYLPKASVITYTYELLVGLRIIPYRKGHITNFIYMMILIV